MNYNTFIACREIADKAESRYGKYSSPHEVLGVIDEEYEEFKSEIHKNDFKRARQEALDIAAVCLRFYEETTAREDSKQI